jgi:hypothetical protein
MNIFKKWKKGRKKKTNRNKSNSLPGLAHHAAASGVVPRGDPESVK